MRKYFYTIAILFLAFFTPTLVSAISVGVDRFIVGGLRTLHGGDRLLVGARATTTDATLEVQGKIASGFYTATTTTATSTFAGDINTDGNYLSDGLVVYRTAAGTSNTHLGFSAGVNSGFSNSDVIGNQAGDTSITDTGSVYIGYLAGTASTFGQNNTYVGGQAGQASNGVSTQSTFIGAGAGLDNTTGDDNTFLGYLSGSTNTTGGSNTIIGSSANVASNNLTNATAIGKSASVASSNSFVLGGTGANAVNVGIGTTSPYAKLSVVGEVVAAYFTGTTTATSTLGGGITAAHLQSLGGLTLAGTILNTSSASSTFSGGILTAGLLSSNGFTMTGGSITSASAASSSFANGMNISAGCFSVGNVCLSNAAGATGSGVSGQTTFWTGASSVGGDISYLWDNTNKRLSVGSTTPTARLAFANISNSTVPLALFSTSTANATGTAFSITANGSVIVGNTGNSRSAATLTNSPLTVIGSTDAHLQFGIQNVAATPNASSDLTVTADIGTDTRYYVNLGINGSGYNVPSQFSLTGALDTYLISSDSKMVFANLASTSASSFVWATRGANVGHERMRLTDLGRLGIGTTSPGSLLSLAGTSTPSSSLFTISTSTLTSTSTVFTVTEAGKIGIGTTTPPNIVSVQGGGILVKECSIGISGTISVNLLTGCNQYNGTLTANATVAFTNIYPGMKTTLLLFQDATGNRRVTSWGSNVYWVDKAGTATTAPSMSTKPNTINVFSFTATAASTGPILVGSNGFSN